MSILFLVEIILYLLLVKAENSSDLNTLQRRNIHYMLSITPDLPDAVEDKDFGIKYRKIPFHDHWSQNLATFFPEAIAFIEF